MRPSLRVRFMNSSTSQNCASVTVSVGSSLARPTGKIEKIRQYLTPSAINSSLNSSSRATIGEVTHVITS